jgi:hypothetical protein
MFREISDSVDRVPESPRDPEFQRTILMTNVISLTCHNGTIHEDLSLKLPL